MEKNTFGGKITFLCQQLGISQFQLSARSKIPQPTLSHYQTGKRLPSYKALKLLNLFAKQNNVNIDFFEDD